MGTPRKERPMDAVKRPISRPSMRLDVLAVLATPGDAEEPTLVLRKEEIEALVEASEQIAARSNE